MVQAVPFEVGAPAPELRMAEGGVLMARTVRRVHPRLVNRIKNDHIRSCVYHQREIDHREVEQELIRFQRGYEQQDEKHPRDRFYNDELKRDRKVEAKVKKRMLNKNIVHLVHREGMVF